MTKNKTKQKLHRLFFPSFHKEFDDLQELHYKMLAKEEDHYARIESFKIEIEKLKQAPKASLADLMRENLALVTPEFYNVEEDGMPKHFLKIEDKSKRDGFIDQLQQIWMLPVFQEMCRYHINQQANWSFKQSDGELQNLAGRFSVNGISLILREVKDGYDEYIERSKPPDKDFDPHDLSEE